MASEVTRCTIIIRNTEEITSAAPASTSRASAAGSHGTNPNPTMARPQIATQTATARPAPPTPPLCPVSSDPAGHPNPAAALRDPPVPAPPPQTYVPTPRNTTLA